MASLPVQFRSKFLKHGLEKITDTSQTTSPKEQHQFFRLCAAIAPEYSERTDEEWRNSISRLSSRKTHNLSPLLLHLSFEALRTSYTELHHLCEPRLLQRSANENLAELRKLLGATEHISCNRLALEDQTVRALPIGFVKEVYESLPLALINDLPLKTVSLALSMITELTQNSDKMASYMRKPENKFRVLLWQCADSQEDSSLFRNWMASREGKLHYLQAKDSLRQLLSEEEFELSLTTLRCYEMVLANDNWWRDGHDDSRPMEGTWLDSFTAHLYGSVQQPQPNLWQVVASSFKLAYSETDPSTALRWLDTVLDDRPSSDGFVQLYWQRRIREVRSALRKEASYDALRSQAMQRQASQRGYY